MLKVTTEPQEKCEVLMTVELDDGRVDQILKTAARKISTQVQVPGFRPGKAPYALVVRRVGEEAIRKQAVEDISDTILQEALKEVNLEAYAQASLEDVSWGPLTMKVRVPVAPAIELSDYRSLRLETPPVEVTEADMDKALGELQEQHAGWKTTERPAQMGDRVVTDVNMRVGAKILVADDKAEINVAEPDPGEGGFDIATPLVGVSAGEGRTYKVNIPDTSDDKEVAGKEATVATSVHEVQEMFLYPLDDDFAQMVGDFGDLEALKEHVREDLRRSKQKDAHKKLAELAFERIATDAPRVEWPLALENAMVGSRIGDMERQAQQAGMPLDNYLRTQNKSRQQLGEDFRPGVQHQLRLLLVAQEIVRREDLSVDTDEITDYIGMVANLAGDRREELLQNVKSEAGVRQAAQDVLNAKLRQRLTAIVKGDLDTAVAGQPAEGGEATEKPAEGGEAAEKATEGGEAADKPAEGDETADKLADKPSASLPKPAPLVEDQAPPKPKATRRKPKPKPEPEAAPAADEPTLAQE